MAIQVNMGGINKTVIQPKVNIGGTWKTVNVVSNNIDGVWKESFRLLTIKIYRYGSLYQTLTVVKGNSVKLPSLGVGYATSSSSTTTTYGSGATITPTSNLNLYAVFSYSVKLYKYGSLYNTLTTKSQSSSATFTLPTCSVNSDDDSFYGWTTTSGSTTRNYQSGASVTTSGMTLYAIFAYTAIISTEYELVSTTNTLSTITVPVAGEVTVGGAIHRSGTSNGVPSMGPSSITLNSSATAPYCKVGSTYISGTTGSDVLDASGQFPIYILKTVSVSANTTITMLGTHETWGSANSYDYGNIYGIVEVKYPKSHTTGTQYRSTK